MEVKLKARPWTPQDLLDDLQLMIDEQPDSYMNVERQTLCTAKAYLEEYFIYDPDHVRQLIRDERDGRIHRFPCDVGDPVWKLVRYKDGKPSHLICLTCAGIHWTDVIGRWRQKKKQEYIIARSDYGVSHLDMKRLGVDWFVSKEDAEDAMKA